MYVCERERQRERPEFNAFAHVKVQNIYLPTFAIASFHLRKKSRVQENEREQERESAREIARDSEHEGERVGKCVRKRARARVRARVRARAGEGGK